MHQEYVLSVSLINNYSEEVKQEDKDDKMVSGQKIMIEAKGTKETPVKDKNLKENKEEEKQELSSKKRSAPGGEDEEHKLHEKEV